MKRTQTGHSNGRLPVAVVILALLLLAASADASSWVDNPFGAFLEAPMPEAGYLASDSPAQTNRRFQLFPEDDPQAHLYDLLSYRYDGHRNFGGRLSFFDDSMHARYYSPNLGRFMSVDPKGGKIGSSQSWNRYSYVQNNPIVAIDPNGEDLFIVYNFKGSGLSMKQQNAVVRGVRQSFRNAGVDRVYSVFKGSSAVPKRSSLGANDARVDVRFTSESLGEGKLGGTNTFSQKSTVSTAGIPDGEAGTTLLTNVAAHEVGHGTGAMTQYDKDAAKKGSFWHPNPAEAGTMMEAQVGGNDPDLQSELLSSEVREFSGEDAAQLQETLNTSED